MHYDNAHMCIEKGKPVLCEKAFTANARQAEDLLAFAKEKGIEEGMEKGRKEGEKKETAGNRP